MDTLEVIQPELEIVVSGIILHEGELRPAHWPVIPAVSVGGLRSLRGCGVEICSAAGSRHPEAAKADAFTKSLRLLILEFPRCSHFNTMS